MKKFVVWLSLFFTVAATAQSVTPNLGLQIPATGSNNWYIPLNYDFSKLDNLLSGTSPLPALSVTGNVVIGGSVTAGSFVGAGGAAFALTPGANINSAPYFSGSTTPSTTLGGAAITGFAFYSAGAPPTAGTSAQMATLLRTATGCNVAGQPYVPQSGNCLPPTGSVTLAGDVTGPSGSNTVVKINGVAVPTAQLLVGTNGSGQIIPIPSQTANLFLASPNGSTGAIVPRAIVSADLPVATTSVAGIVKPDGTTITISGGVISSVGGGISYPTGDGVPTVVGGAAWGTTLTPIITVNGQSCGLGSSCTVTAVPIGAAGGALAGTYANPTLAGLGAANFFSVSNGSGQLTPTPWHITNDNQDGSVLSELQWGTSGSPGFYPNDIHNDYVAISPSQFTRIQSSATAYNDYSTVFLANRYCGTGVVVDIEIGARDVNQDGYLNMGSNSLCFVQTNDQISRIGAGDTFIWVGDGPRLDIMEENGLTGGIFFGSANNGNPGDPSEFYLLNGSFSSVHMKGLLSAGLVGFRSGSDELSPAIGSEAATLIQTLTNCNVSGNFFRPQSSDCAPASGGSMVYPGAGIAVSTGTAWGTSLTAPTSTIAGVNDTQIFTNKSISFDQITSGTNLGHGLVCSTGCVISAISGGFNNANEINGIALSGLTTGLLKNTTSTGVPTIAVAGTDYLIPSGDGSLLTALNASALTSGTVPSAQLPLATASIFGAVKVDGTTITATGGVISAVTGGSGNVSTSGTIITGQDVQFAGPTSIKSVPYPILDAKRDFGAKGDTITDNTCVVIAASTTLHCNDGPFTPANATTGKKIGIPYAGTIGSFAIAGTFSTTIATYVSATDITLAAAPVTSISGPATYTTAAMTANSAIITITGASLAASDIGKQFSVPGAGEVANANSNQSERVVSFTSSTAFTGNRVALQTVTGQTVTVPGALVYWGTDDTTALQAGITAACLASAGTNPAQSRPLFIDSGRYFLSAQLTVCSNLTIYGSGLTSTILSLVSPTSAPVFGGSSLSNINMRDFEMDGRGMRPANGGEAGKLISIPSLTHGRFENLSFRGSSATSFATDFGVDVEITRSWFDSCGSQSIETANSSGGACVGQGTGSTGEMPQTISLNHFVDCGNSCILIENQFAYNSGGVRITGNSAAWSSGLNGYCFTETGGYDTIIANNQCRYSYGGVVVSTGEGGIAATGFNISDNTFTNVGAPIFIRWGLGTGAVQHNTINGGLNRTNTAAIAITAIGSNTVGALSIDGNHIDSYPGDGIQWTVGSFTSLHAVGNEISNGGVSSGSQNPGFHCKATTTIAKLFLASNTAYDTRSTKQQNYGLQTDSGCTITELDDNANQFTGNSIAAENLAGTVTTRYVNSGLTGTTALATTLIASGVCQTVTAGSVNSTAAAGVTTANKLVWGPAVSFQGVTGYAVSTSGALSLDYYMTAGFVNFNVCNWTAASITPGALTLNWSVQP